MEGVEGMCALQVSIYLSPHCQHRQSCPWPLPHRRIAAAFPASFNEANLSRTPSPS